MAIRSGSAYGLIVPQSEIYIDSAPTIYYGDIAVPYFFNPDSDGFYWQLSGTTLLPVYQLGCYENVALRDNLTINDVRCDTVGNKDAIMRRNYLELSFTLKSFFPLTTLSAAMLGGPVTQNVGEMTEKFGLGQIDNNKFYKVYFPKVYDEVDGSYVAFTGHRAKFVSGGELSMTFANAWSLPVTLRLFADDSKPSDQQFATVVRFDADGIS